MTAYGTEFFSMNDVNRLRILQDVIERRLTICLAASRLEISDRHCYLYYLNVTVNSLFFRWLIAAVNSPVTNN
ncbi:hypothetical protein RX33_04523 [Escherichia coli]|nr:hypothetical protein RX33_04523 [Escherichia coli]